VWFETERRLVLFGSSRSEKTSKSLSRVCNSSITTTSFVTLNNPISHKCLHRGLDIILLNVSSCAVHCRTSYLVLSFCRFPIHFLAAPRITYTLHYCITLQHVLLYRFIYIYIYIRQRTGMKISNFLRGGS